MTSKYTLGSWSLADLFETPDAPELKETWKKLDQEVADFEQVRPSLTDDISREEFLALISRLEALSEASQRLSGYAELLFSEDVQNQKVLAFLAQVEEFMSGLANRTLFFEIWWKNLPDDQAARLMTDVGDHAYWLEAMRRFKPHTLSEPEEKIINIKDVTGINALNTLYDSLTNRYVFKMQIDGEVKEMARGELMTHVRQGDPAQREAAYRELYRVYGQDGPILGQMYQTVIRDWHGEQVGLRKHSTPMAVRNLGNDVPDKVVDALLEVCRENAPLFQRFFRLKAHWLGLERLRRYDLYAPLSPADKTYDYQTAADLVLEAFAEFHPRVEQSARMVFDQNRLDSLVRKGKRDGAFCATITPRLTPWVLVNYQGRANDVATMAHELGHAVHSILAADHSIFTAHAPLVLAETASIFGEMLLIDKILSREQDEAVRRDLLFRQLDDAYATVMRQAFFALFERRAHDLTREGATPDDLGEVYFQGLGEQFGDAVDIGDEFRWEWVSIPHFYHTPFYVYAYSFGQLLVLALYRQYKKDPSGFKPRYLDILAAGGSDSPERILRRAGLDISRPEFWKSGFEVIEDLLRDLEALPLP
ncbi:MAG: M3 family oligoendopeptidase [Pseudomonadota bacterium]